MFLSNFIERIEKLFSSKTMGFFGVLVICGVVIGIYFPSLFFDFLELSDDNLRQKNYQFEYDLWMNDANSITFLSFVFNRIITGFSALSLRSTSLILHLINTILVYKFIHAFLRLRKRKKGLASDNRITAVFITLFFGIHPLNSEAVTWISARQTLVFGFLFFTFLNLWIRYVKAKDWILYGLAILISFALFLEQPFAVILLPILGLIDWFLNRKYQRKPQRFLEKIPFLLLTIYVFIRHFFISNNIRQIQESLQITIDSNVFFDPTQFKIFNKLILACYATGSYILKTVFPFFISSHYPYPMFPNENISPEYQIFILLIISILLSYVYLIKSKFKEIIFGLSFMFIAIFPFLPMFSFSGKIMQDSYFYVASVGLILALTTIIQKIVLKKEDLKPIGVIMILVLSVFYGLKTLSLHIYRYDEFSLRNHDVAMFPDSEEMRQKRLEIYLLEGNKKDALQDLNFILEKRQLAPFFILRGDVYREMGEAQKACFDYHKAEEISPESARQNLLKYCIENEE